MTVNYQRVFIISATKASHHDYLVSAKQHCRLHPCFTCKHRGLEVHERLALRKISSDSSAQDSSSQKRDHGHFIIII